MLSQAELVAKDTAISELRDTALQADNEIDSLKFDTMNLQRENNEVSS